MNAQAIAEGASSPPTTSKIAGSPSKVIPAVRPSAPGRRRKGGRGILAAFAAVVGLPTLLAAVYFGLIASPMFVSEAHITIRSSKQQSTSLIEAVFTQGGGGLSSEVDLVADYLRSRDLMHRVENRVGFRDRYSTYEADFFSRLETDATNEDMFDFFRQIVEVTDNGSGLLELTVKGFTADDAHTVIQAAIAAAEKVVNQLSDKAQADAIAAAESAVSEAEARLIAASDALTALQKRSGDIDPRKSAEAILAIVASLEAELAAAKVQMVVLRTSFRTGTPVVKALSSRIGALKDQIAIARKRLAAKSADDIADDVRSFESQRLLVELAQTGYTTALVSREAAIKQAQNDRSYLIAYIPPSMPDVATEPKRLYKITTAFVVSLLAFGVGALVIGAIREHARA